MVKQIDNPVYDAKDMLLMPNPSAKRESDENNSHMYDLPIANTKGARGSGLSCENHRKQMVPNHCKVPGKTPLVSDSKKLKESGADMNMNDAKAHEYDLPDAPLKKHLYDTIPEILVNSLSSGKKGNSTSNSDSPINSMITGGKSNPITKLKRKKKPMLPTLSKSISTNSSTGELPNLSHVYVTLEPPMEEDSHKEAAYQNSEQVLNLSHAVHHTYDILEPSVTLDEMSNHLYEVPHITSKKNSVDNHIYVTLESSEEDSSEEDSSTEETKCSESSKPTQRKLAPAIPKPTEEFDISRHYEVCETLQQEFQRVDLYMN